MEEYWTERERKREVLELFICTLTRSALLSLSLKVRLIKDALHVSVLQCQSIAALKRAFIDIQCVMEEILCITIIAHPHQ